MWHFRIPRSTTTNSFVPRPLDWDNGSPWVDGLSTKEGAQVEFDQKTNPAPCDFYGENQLG